MIFSAAILSLGIARAIRTAWKFRFGFSAECRTVEAMLHQFDELRKDENSARALLMQLRVYQMQNEEGRSGFAVTAFIPNDVLAHAKRFPQHKSTLVKTVAAVLVKRALDGLWNMGHENKVTALVFEPIGDSHQVSTWGDGPRPIHIAPLVDNRKITKQELLDEVNRQTFSAEAEHRLDEQTKKVGEIQKELYESRKHAGLVQCARPQLPREATDLD